MRVEMIGDKNRITVTTTREGELKRLRFNDTEIPLAFIENASVDYDPRGTTIRGSFIGVAVIEIEE